MLTTAIAFAYATKRVYTYSKQPLTVGYWLMHNREIVLCTHTFAIKRAPISRRMTALNGGTI